jgi:hypothetical protein
VLHPAGHISKESALHYTELPIRASLTMGRSHSHRRQITSNSRNGAHSTPAAAAGSRAGAGPDGAGPSPTSCPSWSSRSWNWAA